MSFDLSGIYGAVEEMKKFKPANIQSIEDNLASEFCKKLYTQIVNFDSKLDNDKQVAVRLVNFGQTVTFSVSGIGYNNPSLIHFYGIASDGSPIELIQHVSQISFLLTVASRDNPEAPKRTIGFKSE